MDVNHDMRFVKNILEWQNNQMDLPENKNIFLLSSLKNSNAPEKIIDWIGKTLNQKDNNLVSFPKKNHSNSLQGVVVWLKEGERKDIQINYKDSDSNNEPHVIRNFFFLEKKSSLSWIEYFLNSSFQSENYIFCGRSCCLP